MNQARTGKFWRFGQLALCASLVLLPQVSRAESAFSWEDGAGHVFYGSKPPSSARNVRQLSGKGLSHYSTDKLLKPYQARAALRASEYTSAPRATAQEIPPPPVVQAGSSIKEQDAIPDPQNPDSFAHFPNEQTSATPERVSVIQGKLTVKAGGPREIAGCTVGFRNPSNVAIQNIHVSFEFPEGTLIPAEGPEVIAASSVASFSIPESQLPVRLREARKGASAEEVTPKVIVTADNLSPQDGAGATN